MVGNEYGLFFFWIIGEMFLFVRVCFVGFGMVVLGQFFLDWSGDVNGVGSVWVLIDWVVYVGLFFLVFGLVILLLLQLEIVLVVLLLCGGQLVVWLLVLVIVGNVLGFWVNWWLGCYFEYFCGCCWFFVGEVQLFRVQ